MKKYLLMAVSALVLSATVVNCSRNDDPTQEQRPVIPASDYQLSADGTTLIAWKNENTTDLNLKDDPVLGKITSIDNNDRYTGVFRKHPKLKSIILPENLTHLEDEAFNECSKLESITFPDKFTTILERTFKQCTALASIDLKNVTTINTGAFEKCTSLKSINFSTQLATIGNEAFWDCSSLTSISLPASLTSIGDSAFQNCKNLNTITINRKEPPTLGDWAFYGTSIGSIFVSEVADYENAKNWSAYKGKIFKIK